MFQFLAITQAGCRRSFPRHLLHRITTLAISAVVVLVAQVIYTQPVNADQASRPNIVLIMADDMGWGDPGCYNPDSCCPTPAIDQLAAAGMRFTDAHAAAAVCVPTRYGLMTGRYPFRMKSKRGTPLIEKGRLTIASLLKQYGYRTGMVGKWHLGVKHEKDPQTGQQLGGGPVDNGFDTYFGIPASLDIPPYYYIRNDRALAIPSLRVAANNSPGWSPIQGAFWRAGGIAPGFDFEQVLPTLTDEAIEFLEEPQEESKHRPFFLYLALPAPHTPWLPLKPFRGKSQAGMYGDFVAQVDATVGRVLQTLKDQKLDQNTLVLFTSDNGPVWVEADRKKYSHASTGPWRGMKGDAWEGGHRMPFIARWPGVIKSGSESAVTICHTDVLATLADLHNHELPDDAGEDSFSFLSVLRGEATKAVRPATIHQSSGRVLAVRHGAWKLIPALGSGGFSQPRRVKPEPGGPTGQLYNLDDDPGENTNLFQKHPEVVAKLTKMLDDIRQQPGSRR